MARARKDPVYIVPHFAGLAYAVFVVVVFVFGSLSGPATTAIQTAGICLLVAGIVVLVQSNENLRNVSVEPMEDVVVPEGQPNDIAVLLINRGNEETIDLKVRFSRHRSSTRIPVVPPRQSSRLTLTLPPAKRGIQPLPKISISSIQPAGLCFVWKTYPQASRWIVYPEPRGIPLSQIRGGMTEGNGEKFAASDDVAGHRSYSPGDPVSRIDWAAYARRREAVVRALASGDGGQTSLLRWSDTAFLANTEDRLAQISLWAEECEFAGVDFQVEWPDEYLTRGLTETRVALAAFPHLTSSTIESILGSRS
ncbi:MAG: hypothetical protein Fur0032_08460 [Terrimicrobiaceae bacterium]